jgi:hypothetical protein
LTPFSLGVAVLRCCVHFATAAAAIGISLSREKPVPEIHFSFRPGAIPFSSRDQKRIRAECSQRERQTSMPEAAEFPPDGEDPRTVRVERVGSTDGEGFSAVPLLRESLRLRTLGPEIKRKEERAKWFYAELTQLVDEVQAPGARAFRSLSITVFDHSFGLHVTASRACDGGLSIKILAFDTLFDTSQSPLQFFSETLDWRYLGHDSSPPEDGDQAETLHRIAEKVGVQSSKLQLRMAFMVPMTEIAPVESPQHEKYLKQITERKVQQLKEALGQASQDPEKTQRLKDKLLNMSPQVEYDLKDGRAFFRKQVVSPIMQRDIYTCHLRTLAALQFFAANSPEMEDKYFGAAAQPESTKGVFVVVETWKPFRGFSGVNGRAARFPLQRAPAFPGRPTLAEGRAHVSKLAELSSTPGTAEAKDVRSDWVKRWTWLLDERHELGQCGGREDRAGPKFLDKQSSQTHGVEDFIGDPLLFKEHADRMAPRIPFRAVGYEPELEKYRITIPEGSASGLSVPVYEFSPRSLEVQPNSLLGPSYSYHTSPVKSGITVTDAEYSIMSLLGV